MEHQSAQLGIQHLRIRPLGAQSVNTEKDPKGHESTKDSGPFSFPFDTQPHRKQNYTNKELRQDETRREMTAGKPAEMR